MKPISRRRALGLAGGTALAGATGALTAARPAGAATAWRNLGVVTANIGWIQGTNGVQIQLRNTKVVPMNADGHDARVAVLQLRRV